MTNSEMMTLNLRRIDVCDIRMALSSVICDMIAELADVNTSAERRVVLKASIAKWRELKADIVNQFDEQDI